VRFIYGAQWDITNSMQHISKPIDCNYFPPMIYLLCSEIYLGYIRISGHLIVHVIKFCEVCNFSKFNSASLGTHSINH
jgi:hypothetical protein